MTEALIFLASLLLGAGVGVWIRRWLRQRSNSFPTKDIGEAIKRNIERKDSSADAELRRELQRIAARRRHIKSERERLRTHPTREDVDAVIREGIEDDEDTAVEERKK